MIVAGIGFRKGASYESLKEAFELTEQQDVDALATAESKITAYQIEDLSKQINLPLHFVPSDILAKQETLTHSIIVKEKFGTGSVAEAAALAIAGKNAKLVGPRITSKDGMATAAIAIGENS